MQVERLLKASLAKLANVNDDITNRITKVEKDISMEVNVSPLLFIIVVVACATWVSRMLSCRSSFFRFRARRVLLAVVVCCCWCFFFRLDLSGGVVLVLVLVLIVMVMFLFCFVLASLWQ